MEALKLSVNRGNSSSLSLPLFHSLAHYHPLPQGNPVVAVVDGSNKSSNGSLQKPKLLTKNHSVEQGFHEVRPNLIGFLACFLSSYYLATVAQKTRKGEL